MTKRRSPYRTRTLPEWLEKTIAAIALAFIVWLFFVIGPLIAEALAEGPMP